MNFINNIVAKAKATTTSIIKEKIIIVSTDRLHFDKDFKAVFKQEEDKVNRIADDMRVNGFDKSQPIIVDKDFGILDGNSRFMATKIAGITKVPVIIKEFESKKDAILYELNLQMNRRNIADDSVLIETYHTIAAMTDEKGAKLFTDVEIAEKLGVSPRQISKAKEVDQKASEELKTSLSKGEVTLNMAYNRMKENASPKKATTKYQEMTIKFKLCDFNLLKKSAEEEKQSIEEFALSVLLNALQKDKSAEAI
ncbi:MAG: ParB/RepB/Spo0J family partition protein [Treponema sp.]|uniref:ParB/RepB/Spo0J family partition protein n=1 Tax=Treponema sp. TaxID=166 RepID=UPI00298E2B2B|nr:ParB/RepB/Spo0J family partition protein [Treponema sp.]MCQ2600994.1 ParB/RepB/Spo0J family partition protein [Treponema sp.]